MNIDIIQVRAGASPFRLVDTLLSQIANFQHGLLWDHMESIILFIASYSSSSSWSSRQQREYLPQHQQLLNAKYRDELNPEMNILQWLEEADITADDIEERIYNFATTASSYGGDANNFLFKELLDSSFVRFLEKVKESNSTDPCTSTLLLSSSSSERKQKRFKQYARLCQSLMDNSMVGILEKTNYPIHLCHSEEDELYTFANLPNMTTTPNHEMTLTKQTGDHVLAGGFCFSSDVMFLTSTLFRQYVPVAKHSETKRCRRPSPNTCVDSNLSFEIQLKKHSRKKTVTKRCSWIRNPSSSSWRCGIDGVKEMCPKSCGTCTVCADSTSQLKFIYNGQVVTKDCKWVASRNKQGRCKIAGIRNACRMSCYNCS